MAFELAAGVARNLDVDGVLDGISEEQFQEWQAYNHISPISSNRWDRGLAEFMTLVVRYLGSFVGERHDVLSQVKPERFAPWLQTDARQPKPRRQTESEMRRNLQTAISIAEG